jgi:hypothetical protein
MGMAHGVQFTEEAESPYLVSDIEEPEPKKPGYLWTYMAKFDESHVLTLQGNFVVGATLAEMNGELDKVLAACERQQAKAEIPEQERNIERLRYQLHENQVEYDMVMEKVLASGPVVDFKSRGDKARLEGEQTQLQNKLDETRKLVERIKADIDLKTQKLQRTREKAA